MFFELLFIALFFVSLMLAVGMLVLLVRGRNQTAGRILIALAVVWAVYLSIVAAVAIHTPGRTIPVGQDLCFDEMCFAVVNTQTASQLGPSGQSVTAHGVFYIVTIRVSSRSRSRTQSEDGLRALLRDSGKNYPVSAEGQRAWEAVNGKTNPLTTRLAPHDSVISVQVFDVPREGTPPGLVLTHGFTPGYFVIGESPLFHEPEMMRITP